MIEQLGQFCELDAIHNDSCFKVWLIFLGGRITWKMKICHNGEKGE